MALKDLINRISQSRVINSAKNFLDTDKQTAGFQFKPRQAIQNFARTPLPQSWQKPVENLYKFTNKLQDNTILGTPKRMGNSISYAVSNPKETFNILKDQAKNVPEFARQTVTAFAQPAWSKKFENYSNEKLALADSYTRKAIELSQAGKTKEAQKYFDLSRKTLDQARNITNDRIDYLNSNSVDYTGNFFKDAQSVLNTDIGRAGVGTANVAGMLFNPTGAAKTMAVGGLFKSGIDAVTGNDDPRSFVKGMDSASDYSGFVNITNPIISALSYKWGNIFKNPEVQKQVGKIIAGVGNVFEDRALSELYREKRTLVDDLMSFGVAYVMQNGGTKKDWDYLQDQFKIRGLGDKEAKIILNGLKKVQSTYNQIDDTIKKDFEQHRLTFENGKSIIVSGDLYANWTRSLESQGIKYTDSYLGTQGGFASLGKGPSFDEVKTDTQPKIKTNQTKIQTEPVKLKTQLDEQSSLRASEASQPEPSLLAKPSQPQSPEKIQLKSKQSVSSEPIQLRTKDQTLDNIIAQGRKDIGVKEESSAKSIKQTSEELYTQWVDRYYPITKASQKAKTALKDQKASLRPEYDPEYLVRRLTGAGGIADYRYQTELKPVIEQMDNFNIPKVDMDTYLAHNRMAGFGEVNREVYGSDPKKSKEIVKALETKYPEIKQLAEQLYKYQDQGLKELAESGFLSSDAVKAIRSQNPNYAPLYRVMDQMDDYLGLPTRKTMQGSSPIKKIKGSTKQIDSPLENVIGNTFKQRAAIEKNKVAQSIINLQKMVDLDFKKVKSSGDDTITVWQNGKKEYWQVGKDIADTAKGLNEENTNAILKILQAPAKILRQGATGRNPDFMVPNVVRDQLDASISSKYGYIPLIDYVSGLKSLISKDQYYDSWSKSGAKIDLGEMSGKKSIKQSFDEKQVKKSLFTWMKNALDFMGKYSEQPTRLGLYKKAYQKTGNEMLAMMESRDATVDFARMGSKMKTANSIIPFLNVNVQGFDKLIRAVKDNHGKVLLNSTIYGVLPASLITLLNLSNHKEEYKEIPQYEKDSNFVFVTGRNEDGTVDYTTIPKGNILPVITNPVQSFIEYLADADQQTFGELATQLLSSTLPVLGEGQSVKEVAIKTIGSNLPQAIKPITENLVNKSFYKYDTDDEEVKEIVPYYLKNKPAYQQDYEWTPAMYKKIGAVLNASPLQVQNLMEGYLAGFSKIPANVIDILKQVSEGKDVSRNQVPILRRFLKESYPSSGNKAKYEPPKPKLMDRLMNKASASDGSIETDPEVIKQKLEQRPDLATPQEIATYYESRIDKPESQSAYAQAIYQDKVWDQVSNINQRDSLTDQQKDEASSALLEKIGISKEDYQFYQVAKQKVDVKTLYVIEEASKFKTTDEFFNFLVEGRKKVNNQQLVSSGVIDNLVDEGYLTYTQGLQLKKISFDKDGKVNFGRASKSGSTKAKALKLSVNTTRPKLNLAKVSTPDTRLYNNIKTSFNIPNVNADDIKIRVRQ